MSGFFEGGEGNVVTPHTLDDHTGVNIVAGAVSDGDVLTYSDTGEVWVAAAPTGGGGGSGAELLDELLDVDAPTPTDGYALTWVAANSAWEPVLAGAGAPINLNDVLDVTITTASNGDRLEYSGGNWINVSGSVTTENPVTIGSGADATDSGLILDAGSVAGDVSSVSFRQNGVEFFNLAGDDEDNISFNNSQYQFLFHRFGTLEIPNAIIYDMTGGLSKGLRWEDGVFTTATLYASNVTGMRIGIEDFDITLSTKTDETDWVFKPDGKLHAPSFIYTHADKLVGGGITIEDNVNAGNWYSLTSVASSGENSADAVLVITPQWIDENDVVQDNGGEVIIQAASNGGTKYNFYFQNNGDLRIPKEIRCQGTGTSTFSGAISGTALSLSSSITATQVTLGGTGTNTFSGAISGTSITLSAGINMFGGLTCGAINAARIDGDDIVASGALASNNLSAGAVYSDGFGILSNTPPAVVVLAEQSILDRLAALEAQVVLLGGTI